MRLSSIISMILAFLLAAVACFYAARATVSLVEDRSKAETVFQLSLEGEEWVQVEADGLQLILSGEAANEAARFNVLSITGGVVDAARIIDNLDIADVANIAPPRFSIEILRNNAGVSLIGLIPASSNRAAMVARVTRTVQGGTITDLLEVADYTAPETWPRALEFALAALVRLERTKISVAADRVAITAIADSVEEKRRLESELSRGAPDNVAVAIDISAPRPVITPFTTRFLIDANGPRFDACAADTPAAQREILAAAISAGLNGKAECVQGLGAPSPLWGQGVSLGITALHELGGGSITFSDADVSIIALEGTPQATFDAVTSRLEVTLPDLFTLTRVLPAAPTEQDKGPTEFTATLSPEGQVQLRGQITNELSRNAIETYSQARFGSENVYLATSFNEAAPKGWPLRILTALEALAELSNGSILVQPDKVEVRGNTGNQNARARISQLLSDKLGEGAAYSIAVTYLEALDPIANIPTSEECVERINAIVSDNKITFDPSSTNLDAKGLETVTAIAEVLKECAEIRVEIAGHTDSQGGEQMNQNLSQLRAEAVITQLRAERIVASGLTAKGYGEERPIAENDTEAGREANRRIEFTLIKPEPKVVAPADQPPQDEAQPKAPAPEETASE